ncbi:MAG: HTTM domain-containing protein [Planctomycetaceae bacterium]
MDGIRKNGILDTVKQRISNFFFEEEVPYGLALLRILFPLVILVPMLQRLPRVRELYTADGAVCQLSTIYGWGDMLPELPANAAVGLYVLMIYCLLATSAGWMTRISCVVGTVLYTYFNALDSISTMTKYSVIATDAMLVMCVANSGAIWSVDSWLANRRRANLWPGEPNIDRPKVAVWQARMIQFLVAFMYFGAAFTKMQTEAFFSGDQMKYWMLTNVNFSNPIGEYVALMPAVLIVSAYATIIWEVCFIFTVWSGWQRPVMLFIGFMFHLGTNILLGLYVFPMVCVCLYFAFLRESDVQVLARLYRRFRRRSGWRPMRYTDSDLEAQPIEWIPGFLRMPAGVAFMMIAGLAVVLGIEIEHRTDLYGERNPNGLTQLVEIPADEAAKMLAPSRQLLERDKFFSFDIGTTAIGGNLVSSKSEFTYGDVVLAQTSLNPPHEDLVLECNLVDEDGDVVHQMQTYATREMFRCDFYYHIGFDTKPGRYEFVLESSGKEVGRRSFNLVGTPPTGRVLGN